MGEKPGNPGEIADKFKTAGRNRSIFYKEYMQIIRNIW